MVERYKHDDPMPKDPWIIRMIIKHPKRMGYSLGAFTIALLVSVIGSDIYTDYARKKMYAECIRTQSIKVLAELRNDGFNAEAAGELSNNESAHLCCRRMGRIPVDSGQFVVLCLPVYGSTIMYKSPYTPANN